jgi:hypothetical protein
MRMLLGLVRRDAGAIRLFGRDPADDAVAALHGVSGIIEEPRLYPYLSGRANLELLSDLDLGRPGRRRVEEVLETVELRDQGHPHAPLADNFGHTGVAFSLVVFKVIVVIGPAVIASLVAGDIVAAEDLGAHSRRS